MLAFSLLTYPRIDPVAVHVGEHGIRWYSLAYIAGVVLGWIYVRRLDQRSRPFPLLDKKRYDDLVAWAIGGVILGGRIGYVLFYDRAAYEADPFEAVKIWHGGMSFHGGAIGVIVSYWIFARVKKVPYVPLMDMICCAVPIGLFFGRLANFVNGELFGRVTDVPWAMIFPAGGPEPRHPSQLYEAGLEGALLFSILWIAQRSGGLRRAGLCSGLFLAGYGLSRFALEFVRQPDAQLGTVVGPFSMGQLLSAPMVIVGAYLVIRAMLRPANGTASVN